MSNLNEKNTLAINLKKPKQSLDDRIKNVGEKCRKPDESHNVKDKCKIEEVQSI